MNGRVPNLLLRVGDSAQSGTSNINVVDTDSYWVDGYFEETKMANIRVGDRAEIAFYQHDEVMVHADQEVAPTVETLVAESALAATRLLFGATEVRLPMEARGARVYADAAH